MIEAIVSATIRSPWTEMTPIYIGAVGTPIRTGDRFVCVERHGNPWKRIDAYDVALPVQDLSVIQLCQVIRTSSKAH
jgi:hypothetical protein